MRGRGTEADGSGRYEVREVEPFPPDSDEPRQVRRRPWEVYPTNLRSTEIGCPVRPSHGAVVDLDARDERPGLQASALAPEHPKARLVYEGDGAHERREASVVPWKDIQAVSWICRKSRRRLESPGATTPPRTSS